MQNSTTWLESSVYGQGSYSLLRNFWPILLLSAVLLIPCFWQKHIQCVDLPSHLYNAWLGTQAEAGKLPGLVLSHQATNFLVDDLLRYFLKNWGPQVAEHAVAALSVLVFFWGMFQWVTALAGYRPWLLTPLLAMLTYGIVFRWGFFNFYLSLGFSFWAASVIWKRVSLGTSLLAFALFTLAITAHFLPPVLVGGSFLYLRCWRSLGVVSRRCLVGSALLSILVTDLVLRRYVRCEWPSLSPSHVRLYLRFVGLGQITFNTKYFLVAALVLLVWTPRAWQSLKGFSWTKFENDGLLTLIILQSLLTALMPEVIYFGGYSAPFAVVGARLSLLTAVLLCVLAARTKQTKRMAVASLCATLLFFCFAYRDELAVNRIEQRVGATIALLPANARVVSSVLDIAHGVAYGHFADRPCIGRCYDYGNYEPSSGQFRLKAITPNPFVLSDFQDMDALQRASYRVKDKDIPLFRIHACGQDEFGACAAPVHSGESLKMEVISGDIGLKTR